MISEEVGTSVISRSLQGVTLVAAAQDSHFLCKRSLLPRAPSLGLTVFHVLLKCTGDMRAVESNIHQAHFPRVPALRDLAERFRAETTGDLGLLDDRTAGGFSFAGHARYSSSQHRDNRAANTHPSSECSFYQPTHWPTSGDSNVESWKM